MEKEFVIYEQAVKLKELGFDEPCMFVHDTWGNTKNWTEDGEGEHRNSDKNASIYYSAPLKQQVFRWFRNKYRFSHNICDWLDDYEFIIFEWTLSEDRIVHTFELRFDTYEEAEDACIDELIVLIKNK